MSPEHQEQFRHRFLPQTVVFATHAVAPTLRTELERLGSSRPMVISSGSARVAARRALEGADVALWWEEVVQHVPAPLVERALAAAREASIDAVVTIGGGSATGLGKDLVRELDVPTIAVPTTYSGSEGTNVWGVTRDGVKVTGRDDRVLPDVVVYDAALVAAMPRELAVTSCLNAMAHSIEAVCSAPDPITVALATESIHRLTAGLLRPRGTSSTLSAEEDCLLGAYLAGVVLAGAGTGIHHKICHVLGGSFGMPHALTHASVLPQVVALQSRKDALRDRLVAAFGGEDPLLVLDRIVADLAEPPHLAGVGLRPDDVERATDMVMSSSSAAAGTLPDRVDIYAIIEGARTGRPRRSTP